MATPTVPAETPTGEVRIRWLVALLLRLGLGIHLLNSGLILYLRIRPDPLYAEYSLVLAHVQIALGLALLLGIFTTVAAALAGFFFLVPSLLKTIVLLSGAYQFLGRTTMAAHSLFEAGMVSNLLLAAAVLWFSGVGPSPWSLDRVIFQQRQALDGTRVRSSEPATMPSPPVPGARAAELIATCAESPGPGSTA